MSESTKSFTVLNENGVHASLAVQICNYANKFSQNIYMKHKNSKIDAKSVLGTASLALRKGDIFSLHIVGDFSEIALEKFENHLIEIGFGNA